MKPKKLLFIVIAIVVVAGLVCIGSSVVPQMIAQQTEPTPEVATTSPLTVAVRARGEVVPVTWADLAFQEGGALAAWYVAEEDAVEAGTILGTLETRP